MICRSREAFQDLFCVGLRIVVLNYTGEAIGRDSVNTHFHAVENVIAVRADLKEAVWTELLDRLSFKLVDAKDEHLVFECPDKRVSPSAHECLNAGPLQALKHLGCVKRSDRRWKG